MDAREHLQEEENLTAEKIKIPVYKKVQNF